MENISLQFIFILEIAILASTIVLHFSKKNLFSLFLYFIQSLSLVILLSLSGLENYSNLLALAIASTIILKIVIIPYLFFNSINKYGLKISAGEHLGEPLTIVFLFLLGAVSFSGFSNGLYALNALRPEFLVLSFWSILASVFLVVNKKGVISQVLGILSLENNIVSFALFSGLEQSASLQLGITFNILIWVVVAVLFISMIYRQFGSLDTERMRGLTE